MAFIDLSNRKPDNGAFNIGPRGGTFIQTLSGLNSRNPNDVSGGLITPTGGRHFNTLVGLNAPSEYGLGGLNALTADEAERERLRRESKLGALGNVLVPLDINNSASPMVYGGDTGSRAAYQGGLESLGTQRDVANLGLQGDIAQAEADRQAAELGAFGRLSAAEIGAGATKYTAEQNRAADVEAANIRAASEANKPKEGPYKTFQDEMRDRLGVFNLENRTPILDQAGLPTGQYNTALTPSRTELTPAGHEQVKQIAAAWGVPVDSAYAMFGIQPPQQSITNPAGRPELGWQRVGTGAGNNDPLGLR